MELDQKISFYEKRDFGEKINVTFAFLRQNFVPLGKSILFIAGPFILLVAVFAGIYQATVLDAGTGGSFDITAIAAQGGFSSFLSIFVSALLIAVVYAYLVLYVEGNDYRNITVSDVWNTAKQHYLSIVLSIFVYSVLFVIGFVLLFIPGFMVLAALSFLFIIQMKERISFGAAFSRCFKLVSDNYLSTLGLIFVMTFLVSIISIIVTLPLTIALGVPAFFSISQGPAMSDTEGLTKVLFIVLQVVSSLVSYLLYAILLIAIAFQYSNLVEKKEAAGLLESVGTIGGAQPAAGEDETY